MNILGSGFRTASGIGILVLSIFGAGTALGETVISQETFKDRSGYPCFTTLTTDADKSITLHLSDYKDVWSIDFFVSDRAAVYRRFFDSRGLRDEAAFEDAFGSARIGGRAFEFNDTLLFDVRRQDIDEKSAGVFGIEAQHNVTRALEAMNEDGFEIQGLVTLDGTADALDAFRSCSYDAMGLREGERVETDFRVEYRMLFDDAFENWIILMMRADHCSAGRFDDEAVTEIISSAADAFYPGLLNFRQRSAYRADLEGRLPLAQLSGMNDARTEGCLMVGRLAEMSRMPVDLAIEQAVDLD